MKYQQDIIVNAVDYLKQKYPDARVNNNICMISNEDDNLLVSRQYRFIGMKQSFFKNVNFKKSLFENVALTGSTFNSVNFYNSKFIGSSLANSHFLNVSIDGNNSTWDANNFSQSDFESCVIRSIVI